ncbi:MAG: hypothetical protein J5I54_00155, partial [Bacteroidales bacterium]|nr:hypothetical protein [Bacteroidales bacterium]
IVTSIEAHSEISVKKSSNGKFILQVLKPSNQIWVKLYSDNKLIDSIRLKLERISFKQFFKTKDYGLIVSGSYSKEILQNLNSILVKFNAPWIESPVVRFKITIFQEGEVLHENSYDGNYLDDSKIKEAIAKLKTGGIIEISRIKAVLPYDDGDKPFLMQLICK